MFFLEEKHYAILAWSAISAPISGDEIATVPFATVSFFSSARLIPETCNSDRLSWNSRMVTVSVSLESLYVLQDRRRFE